MVATASAYLWTPVAFSGPNLTFGSCFSICHMQGVSFLEVPTVTLSIPRTTIPGGSPIRGCLVSTVRSVGVHVVI